MHLKDQIYTSTNEFYNSDIRMSMHRNIIPNYSQQDATFLYLFIFTDAPHVSGGSSAHHQEHITVQTAADIVNRYCCYRGREGTSLTRRSL